MKKNNVHMVSIILLLLSCTGGSKKIDIRSYENNRVIKRLGEPQYELKNNNDIFFHNNPPKVYDNGIKILTFKNFQIIRDEYYNYKTIKFWDDSLKVYNHEINLSQINPYKSIRKYKIIGDKNEAKTDEILYDISKMQFRDTFVSEEYPPNYVSDMDVYSARLYVSHENLYNNFEKEFIGICFSIEVGNINKQYLGTSSTVFIFNSIGNIIDTLVFDTPVNYLSTDYKGENIGYVIGGFYGENFEIVYPETYRVYNLRRKKFISKNDDFLGLSQGAGYIKDYFFFYFKNERKTKMILIDVLNGIYLEHLFRSDELSGLKITSKGLVDEKDNRIVYSFESDFSKRNIEN